MTEFLNKNRLYIILFSSSDPISKSIKCLESICLNRKCIFSHVGILFHSDILLSEFKQSICRPNSFLVVESTLSGELNDNVYNTCKKTQFGVQVRSLDELIKVYYEKDSKIGVAEIDEEIEELSVKFTRILHKYINMSYERYLYNLLTIHIAIPSINSKTMFCSELVYRILKDLKIVSAIKNPKKVSPNTVLRFTKLKELIYLVA